MAINIKFDLVGNPEPPTIILANRNGNKLGQLDVNTDSISLTDKFNDSSEFSFTLNKYIDGKVTNLWDKVVDFKLVYCLEWDMWFEITVELDEEDEIKKTVFCTQLGQAELSQIMLYNVEINTEDDIARDDYKITVLYNETDKDKSLLDRLLEKAPHYSIEHVDATIANIQRSFSFDDTSIYDAFQDIAEEIGCLFIFNSNSDENGKIKRTISVYDLQQNCSSCGHRGEFTGKCPKCGSTNVKNGYGEDTLIFVTSDELANGGIELTTDTDSVKNCFKLEAGDDLMTATVRNCNPNGTDYIWRFSSEQKEDMSDLLVNKLDSYDNLYKQYYNDYVSNVDNNLLNEYNKIVNKYSTYNKDLQKIESPIKGYSALMNAYYNVIDIALYLESGLMPTVDMGDTTALKQAALLTTSNIPSIAITDVTIASLATVNSAILAMAKTIVRSTYKVQVNTSELVDVTNGRNWKGNFTITNYSDEEDTATSAIISVPINDDLETFVKQKIDKALNKEDTDDLSISGLFKKNYNDFCNELKKYALNPLNSFHDACQACIDILIEQGIGNKASWGSTSSGADSNLYEKLYVPYYNKLTAIEKEIKVREDEINTVSGVYDTNGTLIKEGLKTNIEKNKNDIQDVLNFKNYLGNELWLEFSSYRREDKYSNDNYISDGLNNAELFKKALEFFEVAQNEIYKSSEMQHSISTSLNNLLTIPKFESFVDKFKLGNWIRVQVDDDIYKLRLIEYEIDYGSFDTISVDFSDVTKLKNGITDVKNVLSQASSMASSYSYVQRQASQGSKGNDIINSWVEDGLSATNTKIVGTSDQNQVWDKNGILCRQYDAINDSFSPEQLKIINSTIAITDDNWETTKTAIGKFYYTDPNTGELITAYGVNGETIVGKLLIGKNLALSNSSNNLEFGEDGLVISNDTNKVVLNPNAESIFNISSTKSGSIFSLNDAGELVIVGNITALNGSNIESDSIKGLATVATTGDYRDLSNKPTLSTVATTGSYNDLKNKPTLATVATTGSYDDLKNKPTKLSEFKNDSGYISDTKLNEAVSNALQEAKDNGEFNGKDGVSVTHSWKGTVLSVTSASGTSSADLKGEKGDTPIKGVDYFTDEEKEALKNEIIEAVLAELNNNGNT